MKSWFLAIRPKTLTAALVPILVGTSLAFAMEKQASFRFALFALLSSLCIQIGTNLINDAEDFERGADTEHRLGPVRVTQSSLLSPQQVKMGGMLCFGLSVLFALPLVLAGGWPIIFIGVLSLLAGYAYTAGPFPLAYRGLGDLFVLIFFGWVAVGGMYFLNTGKVDFSAVLAGTQVGLLATVLIAINNLRDHRTDREAGKRTLAVRMGPGFAKGEIALAALTPFLGSVYWFYLGKFDAAVFPLLVLPMAVSLVWKITHSEPSSLYNSYLAQAALLQLTFGALLTMGLCCS